MEYRLVALTAILTLGLTADAMAGPVESGESILVSQLVEDMTVDQAKPVSTASARISRRAILQRDHPIPVSDAALVAIPMAPRLDATQSPVTIDPPIIAGTVREDPPGTGMKPPSNKDKKKRGWLQRKLFGS